MKKLERPTRILIAMVAIPILLYAGLAIYIHVTPEPEPVYLGHSDGDLQLGQVWEEEGAFQIQMTDVVIGDVDENGIRQCEAVFQVTNENVVAHKKSNTMLVYQFAKDSDNAYRITHGSYNHEERMAKIDEEYEEYRSRLKDVMEIWFRAEAMIDKDGVWKDQVKSTELSELAIEKGETATFRYGFTIRESVKHLRFHFNVLASKNHSEQYHGWYIANVDDILSDQAAT